jgi:hypothetical protein
LHEERNEDFDETPLALKAAERDAERRRDAMQGHGTARKACDEDESSVWVWEGGAARLGRFGKRGERVAGLAALHPPLHICARTHMHVYTEGP